MFSPALTDGSIGDMIYFHSYKNPGLVLDIVEGKRHVRISMISRVPNKLVHVILHTGIFGSCGNERLVVVQGFECPVQNPVQKRTGVYGWSFAKSTPACVVGIKGKRMNRHKRPTTVLSANCVCRPWSEMLPFLEGFQFGLVC